MTLKRTILITGSTDGLGRRTAERLASPNVLLLLHGRNAERGNTLVAAVRATGGSAIFYQADFASLHAVRRMAETIASAHAHIDVVVNNAGVGGGDRRMSEDGYELHFAVNHLAHFLLTWTLLPCLGQRAPSRVISVASASQKPINFSDVMFECDYDEYRAYSQSKLANIMHSLDLAHDLGGVDLTSASLHPGSYLDTNMIRAAGGQPITPVDVGADAVLALVNGAAAAISGRHYDGQRETRAHPQAYDLEARRKLRQLSMELTGLKLYTSDNSGVL